ncbi:MAG: bifunctional rhamnulose-1-phosphate aldolase/short-chain dehydrogenase [Nitrospirota bacterium]
MKSLWSDRDARGLDGLDVLVYTSRLIGASPNLVLWGGGNSSAKVTGKDHAGRSTRILYIKGSGSDMKTITAQQFTPLRLDDLLPLISRQAMTDEDMVAYQAKSTLEPGAPKPSIETLLHAFIPATHIYHTHADAICTLTDVPNSQEVIRKIYGEEIVVVPYLRPGFLLSKRTGEAVKRRPNARAVILDKHGLITWGESAKAAYLDTIKYVTMAERYIGAKQPRRLRPRAPIRAAALRRREVAAVIAPVLRGEVSRAKPVVLLYDDRPEVLEFTHSADPKTLTGPFTPDHLLYTKPWPLAVDRAASRDERTLLLELPRALERYRTRYAQYFAKYRAPGVTMGDPNPRIILIPGVGMFTTGKNRRETMIARDLYLHTMGVIRAAEALGGYRPLPPRDLCDFEYWPMENFKLTLAPPEKTLSRRIALITGAAGGIGRAIAERLLAEGAVAAMTDVDVDATRKLAEEYNRRFGDGHAVGIEMDVTDERSVRRAFAETVLTFGGLDIFVSNAGIAHCAPVDRLSRADWERSVAVNATGHLLTSQEAIRIMRAQGIGGAIVVISTKNVLSPGQDFGAYSASKAAQNQLAKIMAIENARYGIRVNMINPDAVFLNSGLWSPEIRAERAKAHGISIDQVEDFYAKRNLLGAKILPQDVAEAVLFFASNRSSKTTGSVLPVDGGVKDAFPR